MKSIASITGNLESLSSAPIMHFIFQPSISNAFVTLSPSCSMLLPHRKDVWMVGSSRISHELQGWDNCECSGKFRVSHPLPLGVGRSFAGGMRNVLRQVRRRTRREHSFSRSVNTKVVRYRTTESLECCPGISAGVTYLLGNDDLPSLYSSGTLYKRS